MFEDICYLRRARRHCLTVLKYGSPGSLGHLKRRAKENVDTVVVHVVHVLATYSIAGPAIGEKQNEKSARLVRWWLVVSRSCSTWVERR